MWCSLIRQRKEVKSKTEVECVQIKELFNQIKLIHIVFDLLGKEIRITEKYVKETRRCMPSKGSRLNFFVRGVT